MKLFCRRPRDPKGRQITILPLISSLILFFAVVLPGCSKPIPGPSSTPFSNPPNQTSLQAKSNTPVALKVTLSTDGIYRITSADIQAAGLSGAAADLQKASLSLRGQPVPVWMHSENNGWVLYFYGQATDSLYTPNNVYWLQLGSEQADLMKDAAPAAGDAGNTQVQETYTRTLRTEPQLIYYPQVTEGDHWFWTSIPAPKSHDFEVTLDQLSPDQRGQSRLKVNLYGSTEASQTPDHHVQISVNGQQVVDESWDGQGWHTLEGVIPGGVLKEGKNQIRISLPGDTGAQADVVYVNWIEFVYTRNLVAEHDQLEFNSVGQPQKLAGFSGQVNVFDISDRDKVERWPAVLSPGQDGILFQGQSGHRYLAVEPQGILTPGGFSSVTNTPVLTSTGGSALTTADYIAIGPTDLLAPLKPLLDWRRKQGLKVLEVPLDSIYDQFNHGMPEPQAIRSFLIYALRNWQPAPRYVLLVGDATYDPRSYTAPLEANRLPVLFVETSFGGETASDVMFAQAEPNTSPQIAVGRIPARQPDQVKTYVDKVLAYEQATTPADWQNRILAVADGQDAGFQQEAQSFLDQLPQSEKKTLFSPEAGVKDAGSQVKSYFSDGYLLVAYFGHGSVNMWGKDSLFTTTDVQALANQKALPIVLTFTCLNGFFTHPKVESMAEALLFQPDGGAVSVLAPTSLTLPTDQSFLEDSLVKNLLKRPALTLGEAFLAAQQEIPTDNPGSREVLETFQFFGDPALKIAWPAQ
jgi:hypothetical protein